MRKKIITISIAFLLAITSFILAPAITSRNYIKQGSDNNVLLPPGLKAATVNLSTDNGGAYDDENKQILTSAGNPIFYSADYDLCFEVGPNNNVKPIIISSTQSPIVFDQENDRYVGLGNETLKIWTDSFNNPHLTYSGNDVAAALDMRPNREVYLVETKAGKKVFLYREEKIQNGWEKFWGYPKEYNYLNLNFQMVNLNDYKTVTQQNAVSIGMYILGGLSFLGGVIICATGNPLGTALIAGGCALILGGSLVAVDVIKTINSFTVKELEDRMTYATKHPWPNLMDYSTDLPVLTMDLEPVYINPVTKQLVTWKCYAIFNLLSGLPYFYDEESSIVYTWDGNDQSLNLKDGILTNAFSITAIMESDIEYRMSTTVDGKFDIIILVDEFGNQLLINGDSAEGIARPTITPKEYDELVYSTSLLKAIGDWFKEIGKGIANFFNGVWTAAKIAFVVGVVLVVTLIISLIVKAGSTPVNSSKRKRYSRRNYNKRRK